MTVLIETTVLTKNLNTSPARIFLSQSVIAESCALLDNVIVGEFAPVMRFADVGGKLAKGAFHISILTLPVLPANNVVRLITHANGTSRSPAIPVLIVFAPLLMIIVNDATALMRICWFNALPWLAESALLVSPALIKSSMMRFDVNGVDEAHDPSARKNDTVPPGDVGTWPLRSVLKINLAALTELAVEALNKCWLVPVSSSCTVPFVDMVASFAVTIIAPANR